MSNRPEIPAEMKMAILFECGHRCAICGIPFPLENAHIISWSKSKMHKQDDLICLCANCHELADRGKWSKKTLRWYKDNPWVLRQFKNTENEHEHWFIHFSIAVDSEELTIDDLSALFGAIAELHALAGIKNPRIENITINHGKCKKVSKEN